jgi:hypothetical protein
MDFEIPNPLKTEHEELHAELIAAIDSGCAVGDAAKAVAGAARPKLDRRVAAVSAAAMAGGPVRGPKTVLDPSLKGADYSALYISGSPSSLICTTSISIGSPALVFLACIGSPIGSS